MTWSTTQVEYEGFPLLLRRPDFKNIWRLNPNFPFLISVEHILEKASPNGLPESKYNKTLDDFDNHMCSLIRPSDGIIFLIETFAGKRNYYYYTISHYDIDPLTNKIKKQYKVDLDVSLKQDPEWSFIKEYPFRLYP